MGELLNCNPLCLQLLEVVRTRIESRGFIPITAIFSEHEIEYMYRLQQLAVRDTIAALIYDGLLEPGRERVRLSRRTIMAGGSNLTVHLPEEKSPINI